MLPSLLERKRPECGRGADRKPSQAGSDNDAIAYSFTQPPEVIAIYHAGTFRNGMNRPVLPSLERNPTPFMKAGAVNLICF